MTPGHKADADRHTQQENFNEIKTETRRCGKETSNEIQEIKWIQRKEKKETLFSGS